jgi:hypothetical protein
MFNNQPVGLGDGEDNLPPPPNLGPVIEELLRSANEGRLVQNQILHLLMQPPKVKVVAVAVAITMVDLKIRAIPLS